MEPVAWTVDSTSASDPVTPCATGRNDRLPRLMIDRARTASRVDVRKLVRTAVTFAPPLANAKAWVQYSAQRVLRKPFEVEFAALADLVEPGSLCLDLGANRGRSIDAMKMLPFPVRIVAFEPQPERYRRLIKRFWKDFDVTVLPFGASDEASNTQIYVPYYRGYCFDGLASLQREGLDEWLRWSIYGFEERKVEVKAFSCQTVRLDDLELGAVAFAKLDIQGSEYTALRGALETLHRDKPRLMIETPSPEVVALLEPLGYQRYTYVDGRMQRSDAWTLNAFFLP
jgi:FkbM family methyltransferase